VSRTSLAGIALIVFGIIDLTYHGTSYHALPKEGRYQPLPTHKSVKRVHPAIDSVALPAVGALSLLGGVAILAMGRRK
jgi:hypothetical protein